MWGKRLEYFTGMRFGNVPISYLSEKILVRLAMETHHPYHHNTRRLWRLGDYFVR